MNGGDNLNYMNSAVRPYRLRVIIPIVLSIIISFFPHQSDSLPRQKRTDSVKVNILSKHLRLMKENKGELIFTFPAGTSIRGEDYGSFESALKISSADNRLVISAGGRSLNSGKYGVYPAVPDSLFRVTIDGEERSYPLPLEILRSNGTVKLFITETTEQYAVDSASAEIGYVKPENSEALYSLALAIHGRCSIAGLKKKHEGCDFCDLTCCQSYRGRSGMQPLQGPFVNTTGLRCGLFFHSSSGGRLFSESVFNSGGRRVKPPVDIIYSENFLLSRKLHPEWEAVLPKNDAAAILADRNNSVLRDISYSPDKEIVNIIYDAGRVTLAPEDFRLRINRIKGWSFIKSNNYTVKSDGSGFVFRGSGLGHCAGMSIEGAVQLAERGYSRYEILEHYYPDVKYFQQSNPDSSYQYVTYDTMTGSVMRSSTGPALLERRIPCGSVFKLFTVIYLAEERPDILFSHTYFCSLQNHSPLPEQCWDRKGHGMMNAERAISNSCNIWFASLYDKIDQRDYFKWFREFVKSQDISMTLPRINSMEEWSSLLAGLDFRTDISVRDLIRLSIFIRNADKHLPPDAAVLISDALRKTFTSGTAEITDKDISAQRELSHLPPGIWGKTGTVIAGTNSHHSYGIFTGGCGDTGIVTILRKGRGVEAAHLSLLILKKEQSEISTGN